VNNDAGIARTNLYSHLATGCESTHPYVARRKGGRGHATRARVRSSQAASPVAEALGESLVTANTAEPRARLEGRATVRAETIGWEPGGLAPVPTDVNDDQDYR
jgi:hypothetical protein